DQTQGGRSDLGRHFTARDIGPRPVDESLDDDVVGVVALVVEHGAGDVVVLADRERRGNTELTHDLCLSGRYGTKSCRWQGHVQPSRTARAHVGAGMKPPWPSHVSSLAR